MRFIVGRQVLLDGGRMLANIEVNERPEGLNQIVGEIERVLLTVMKQPQRWVQAMRNQPSRNGTTQAQL